MRLQMAFGLVMFQGKKKRRDDFPIAAGTATNVFCHGMAEEECMELVPSPQQLLMLLDDY